MTTMFSNRQLILYFEQDYIAKVKKTSQNFVAANRLQVGYFMYQNVTKICNFRKISLKYLNKIIRKQGFLRQDTTYKK